MNRPISAFGDVHRLSPLRKTALSLLGVLILGIVLLIGAMDRRQAERNRLEPLSALEGPVRMQADGQDRVYLLTSQVERPLVWRTLTRRSEIDASRGKVNIDLWALDAGTMAPIWRQRISDKEESALRGATLLGADGDTLWLHVGQPVALSARDGRRLADAGGLAKRNPALAGQIVEENRYFGMDAAGAWLLDAQARHWRIDGRNFAARRVGPSRPAARDPGVVLPAKVGAGQLLSYSQQRGVDLGKRWLGMFSDAEMEKFQAGMHTARHGDGPAARLMAYTDAYGSLRELGAIGQRRRVWQADRRMVSAAPEGWNDPMPDRSPSILPDDWGAKAEYSDFRPLPESGQYLDGGLLALETYRGVPLFLHKPDSVLVLHRDRLGEHGQYRLARVAGPKGQQLWDAKLPLTNLNALLPGRDSVVLLGRWFQTEEQVRQQREEARKANPGPWLWRWLDAGLDDMGHRDQYHDAAEQLVSVDHASGRVSAFDMSGPVREFSATPASETPADE